MTVSDSNEPIKPGGKPVKFAPIAPVVTKLISVIGLFTQTV